LTSGWLESDLRAANMVEVAGRVLRRKRPAHGAHSAGTGNGRTIDGPSADPIAPVTDPHAERDVNQPRLGEILVRLDAVDESSLAQALADQAVSGGRLGQLLIERGLISDAALARALAEQFGLPLADLAHVQLDSTVTALLPEHVARAAQAVPLTSDDTGVEVVLSDPTWDARRKVAEALGRSVKFQVAPAGQVRRALDTAYRATENVDRLVAAFEAARPARLASNDITLTDAAASAPVVRVVDSIVTQALRERASDVHLEPQDNVIRVRYRVDGALHDALTLPAQIGPALISRLKIMAGMNIVERRRPQDGQFTLTVDGRGVDIRTATVATIWGEKCVLRLLDKSRSLIRLGELGMTDDTHTAFSRLVRSPFGMVLCAGPTGSGKTTTLYASLAEINQPHRNIMTIEDPVEYVFPSINQIQTSEAVGINFATGLKSILRQDPDVILVGECRDPETARIAVQSALTGHFVLSTLHATDAVAALHRLLDMGIESFLVASSMLAVVGQRLVRRICDNCKTTYTPTAEELAFYVESGGADPERDTFWHGAGCNFCADTGYQDRIGVYELLHITPEIKRLVVGWATQEELRRLAVSQGMRTLQEEAVRLVDRDVTTLSEVIRTIYAL
jgi:type IV pilus assembly protein PilB